MAKNNRKTGTNSNLILALLLTMLVAVSIFLFVRLKSSTKTTQIGQKEQTTNETTEITEEKVITPTRGLMPTVAVKEGEKVKVYSAVVDMNEQGYSPLNIEVVTGGQVRFVNTSDSVKTPVVFDTKGKELVSMPIPPNLNLTHPFEEQGTYTFSDKNNPNIKGTIVVTAE